MGVRFQNPLEEREHRAQTRLVIFYVGLCVGYLIVVGRAVLLMLQDNNKLETIAMKQYKAAIQNETNRSRILDSRGHELAISVPSWSLYADPREVEEPSQAAKLLSPLLEIPPDKLKNKLEGKRKFIWLKRHIGSSTMEKLGGLSLKGIHSLKENVRFYPHGELAGHVIGAVGIDSQALAGIEMSYDPYLMIAPKASVYLRDARGKFYQTPKPAELIQGKGDVYLTIDKNLQFFAEEALKNSVLKFGAKAGLIVMIDPKTGDILAMANDPPFNPNDFSGVSWGSWRNRALTDIYEPGSTFKIITAAAALEESDLSLEEKIDCENGGIELKDGHVIHDHKPFGKLTLPEIIKYSSNVGVYKLGQRVGREKFYQKIVDFGFGSKTGIDFPGEVSGILNPPKKWQPIDEGTLTYGYGIGATPLQIVSAYAAIANGGVQMRPHLVEKIIGSGGEVLYEARHEERGRPILPRTAELLTGMLARVVEKGGTAPLAAIPEFSVAGKTGTAKKVDPKQKGYLKGKYVSTFVGFAPVEEPRLVLLILIDEPKGSYYGGVVAAPIFKEVMLSSLNYLGLPPRENKRPLLLAGPPLKECPDSDRFCGWRVTQEGELFKVPDFQGASMRQVLRSAGNFPIGIDLKGRGGVVRQRPKPGEMITAGSKIFVEFEPLY